LKIEYNGKTDVGKIRKGNEDSYGVLSPIDNKNAHLFVVCDGMGGQVAGGEASQKAVATITEYIRKGKLTGESLRAAAEEANRRIFASGANDPPDARRGTTVTALLIAGRKFYVAHVGDSRAYLLRGGKMRQITTDHTLVAEAVASGMMTPEEAAKSPQRNVITRAVGHKEAVKVDLLGGEVEPGDTFLLCSDGLTGEIGDKTIKKVIGGAGPARAADELISLANEAGGRDNITAVVVSVGIVRKRKLGRAAAIAAAVVALALLAALYITVIRPAMSGTGEPMSGEPIGEMRIDASDGYDDELNTLMGTADELRTDAKAKGDKDIEGELESIYKTLKHMKEGKGTVTNETVEDYKGKLARIEKELERPVDFEGPPERPETATAGEKLTEELGKKAPKISGIEDKRKKELAGDLPGEQPAETEVTPPEPGDTPPESDEDTLPGPVEDDTYIEGEPETNGTEGSTE
jgi:serine/threonine protein phosphatase PrpC